MAAAEQRLVLLSSLSALSAWCLVALRVSVCSAPNLKLSSSPENSFEGRVYHRVPVDVTWPVARSMANALTYKGVSGSLVSIRSAAEQAFVTSSHLDLQPILMITSPCTDK